MYYWIMGLLSGGCIGWNLRRIWQIRKDAKKINAHIELLLKLQRYAGDDDIRFPRKMSHN